MPPKIEDWAMDRAGLIALLIAMLAFGGISWEVLHRRKKNSA
jgi:hypothetical protein